MSDADLDDILDEAFDELDAALEKEDEASKKNDAKVDNAVEQASMNPISASLLQALTPMLNPEGNDADLEGLTSGLRDIVEMLDGYTENDEDKEKLSKLKDVLKTMGDGNVEAASELLREIEVPTDHLPADPTAAAASSEGDDDGMNDALAKTLIGACTSPEMIQMIELMRDGFPAWLKAHPDLPEEERKRHEMQYQKCTEVCELLKQNTESSKAEEIVEAFSQLADLGELPTNLADFTPVPSEEKND
eukprot:gene5353-3850_t